MEFTCVFSIGGSLASYLVQSQNNHDFTATLRNNQGSRTDIPTLLTLERTATGWQCNPPHEELLRNLVSAIEASDSTLA